MEQVGWTTNKVQFRKLQPAAFPVDALLVFRKLLLSIYHIADGFLALFIAIRTTQSCDSVGQHYPWNLSITLLLEPLCLCKSFVPECFFWILDKQFFFCHRSFSGSFFTILALGFDLPSFFDAVYGLENGSS